MKNLLIVIGLLGAIIGILYALGGPDAFKSTKKDEGNKIDIIAEPAFTDRAVNVAVVVQNRNDFTIITPRLVCEVYSITGRNLKNFAKTLDITVKPGSSQKLSEMRLGFVDDTPAKMKCYVDTFKVGN